jgi:hypothetical protein
MKKKWFRLVCIGMCHIMLYIYLIPHVIYPQLGKPGVAVTALTAAGITIMVLKNTWVKKKE